MPGVTTITENPIIHKIPLFMSLVKCQLQAVQSLSKKHDDDKSVVVEKEQIFFSTQNAFKNNESQLGLHSQQWAAL